jgi:uncharacterized protein (TIGR02099 family)
MSLRLILFARRLYHYLAYVAGGAVIAVCIVALAFKFWLMPNISVYQGVLEDAAAAALGQPVDIGKLEADWSGLNPRVILSDVRMRAADDALSGAPLVLPRVEASFSWWSLVLLDLRLTRLSLERPQLFMHRDAAGVISVAGVAVNQPGESGQFSDWLLKQPRIVVKDAQIVWLDDKINAPELRFSSVRILLENRLGRHRFGGIATPTAAAARRLEMRGDLKGRSLSDWAAWSGEIYARVDGARFESWGSWVPWAQESVRSGIGDMRFWATLDQGKLLGLSGDVRLEQVAINIDKTLPDLVFDRLTGQAGWARIQNAHSFYVDRLRFKTPGEAPSEPASVRLNLTQDGRGGFQRIGVSARNLRLEALTALTGALPIPRRGHDLIQRLNPRGLVEVGAGHWAGADDYALKLSIRAAGLNPFQDFPGISGLGADIEANPRGGVAAIDGQGMTLTLPNIFRHDLHFQQLDGGADWRFDADGMRLNFAAKRIVNPDLEGVLRGQLRFPDSGSIQADISARLSRGEAAAVYRYLPRVVGDDTYNWLQRGLIAGKSDDVRLVLKGPLDRFPFDKGGGKFNVAINIADGVLDYAPGWPRIEDVKAMLVFHEAAMTLNARSGRVLDARLGQVKVSIPDLHDSPNEVLFIDGLAHGESRAFLDFIRASPVNQFTDRFTEPFKAVGDGRLELHLRVPLRHVDATTLNGSYTFEDNHLDPGGDLPALTGVGGGIHFTQNALHARDIRAEVLGLPVKLNIDTAAASDARHGVPRVQLHGEITPALLKPHLPAALAARFSGAAGWRAEVGLGGASSGFELISDLRGLAINLPAPFGKTAEQAVPLHVAKDNVELDGSAAVGVLARYGELCRLRVLWPDKAPMRAHLRFGPGEVAAPSDAGLWLSGALRTLDLDAWRRIDLTTTATAASPGLPNSLPLREASIAFNELRLFDRRLSDSYIKLRPAGLGWRVNINGRELHGEVVTVPSGDKVGLLANFKRLSLLEAETGKSREIPPIDSHVSGLADALASLELSADSTLFQGRELGELHLRIAPDAGTVARGTSLRLEHFLLRSGDGLLRGKGLFANHARRPTSIALELESDNLGKLFGRLGLPGHLKGGSGVVSGPLSWMGGVEDFNLATLNGNLTLNLKQGQFTKVEPGAGKLLGMLSLQSLPRRIALDFHDVFSDGFAFDEILGTVHLARGSAYAKDLRMNGPAAKVRMSGVADLARETQNLRVTIEPRLEDTVAVAGALLGGPVIGLGTFIANKILRNPIGQAASFEYVITGPWADPVVTKVVKTKGKGEG